MSEAIKLVRCPKCNRVLREDDVEQAKARHANLVERACGTAAEFVRDATWGAYLASLRRCRCGSKAKFRPLSAARLRGQLQLGLDSVVLQ
ncbi:MAG: hypothetical protein JST92_14980 [Deltaproteobacteria bacterium]|nr:hypothetical protein [Deltaproteobacteria bacterium]